MCGWIVFGEICGNLKVRKKTKQKLINDKKALTFSNFQKVKQALKTVRIYLNKCSTFHYKALFKKLI